MGLNLSGIKESDKAVLLDGHLALRLLGTVVEMVVDKFRKVRRSLDAFGMYIPRRVEAPPKSSMHFPGTSSWGDERRRVWLKLARLLRNWEQSKKPQKQILVLWRE